MISVTLFVIFCAVFVLWQWFKPRRVLPPTYPGALPIIGHAYKFIGSPEHMWKTELDIYKYGLKSGDLVRFQLGLHDLYVISNLDDSLTVANTCLEKPYFFKFVKDTYNRGLITANVPQWKIHRKLLNPAFNQQVLNAFVKEYSDQAKSLVSQLMSEVGRGPFDIHPFFTNNLLTTVCRTTLGLQTTEHSTIVNNYAHATNEILAVCYERILKAWLHLPYFFNLSSYRKKQDEFAKVVKEITTKVINDRKSEIKANGKQNEINSQTPENFKPLLDVMLHLADEQDAFSDEEIREHLDTIIAAAFDTTATGLTFVLMLVGTHKEVQENVYKELQEVLGGQDGDLNRHDLPKLVYLEAVIKETLRLYPPVPRTARSCSGVKLKNYTLPSNCTCIVSLYGINRHPMWGPDADQFRPERWLDPATLPDNPNAFASFSFGRRNCIGKLYGMMAMKTTLAYILRKFCITGNINNVKTRCDLVLKPVYGHHITLELRK